MLLAMHKRSDSLEPELELGILLTNTIAQEMCNQRQAILLLRLRMMDLTIHRTMDKWNICQMTVIYRHIID